MFRSPYNDYEGSRGELLRMLAEQGEEPAFIRRARAVNDAWERLLAACQSQRNVMLKGPQMHLSILASRVNGDWARISEFLADEEQVRILEDLHQRWKQRRTTSPRDWFWSLRGSLQTFVDSADRFNRRWKEFLQSIELEDVNSLRREFNKFYPVEKACAFDCQDIDRFGFELQQMVTTKQLCERFPPLEVPKLRGGRRGS